MFIGSFLLATRILHLPGGTGSAAVCVAALLAAGYPASSRAEPAEQEPDSLSFAIASIQAEIRANPRDGSVRVRLAEAYKIRENYAAARAEAEAAFKLGLDGVDSSKAGLLLAEVALKQGRTREARTRLASLASRGDASPAALAYLAQLRWDDHQREAAVTLAAEALGRGETMPEERRWLAERWKDVGRPDMALHLRRSLAARGDATEEDLFQVGLLSQQLGRGEEAFEVYSRLLERRPLHPQANYNLSLLCLAVGDTVGATRHLERAIQGDPGLHRSYMDLAMLYMGTRRLADARRVLTLFKGEIGRDSLLAAEVEEILKSLGSGSGAR